MESNIEAETASLIQICFACGRDLGTFSWIFEVMVTDAQKQKIFHAVIALHSAAVL